LYDKPGYWVELANLYGELGNDEMHLAIMEAAYQQGYIEKSRDMQTLAQLYFYAGAPYKAARLLSDEIENKIITPDLKVYTFLAQSWEAANELEKAIEVLKTAVGITNDHAILQRLARLHIDLERWPEALNYARQAEQIIEHIENPGNVYVAKGIALLNMKRFDESISAFRKAKNIAATKRIATEWLKFAERESELYNTLQLAAEVSE
jgi:tetratricopeptide (TPR) repeat protein